MGIFGPTSRGWHSPIILSVFLLILTSLMPSSLVWGQQVEPYRRENFNVLFEGQNAVFVCDPSGWDHDSLTYQWSLNDTHIIATGRTFTVNNVQKSDSGLYKCIVRGKVHNKEIVAEQSTFAYVKKAETMLTQVVDEGVSVTIICNVSDSNIPTGSSNIRYQWHNPNGTLISNQWYLRLAKIKLHESGVYVCTVSVDVDGTTHEASRGTKIQVKRAGNVIFLGLSGHTLDVMETSPVHQTCRVQKDHGGANYTYHWLGPDGKRISDNNQLRIDYALRTKHSGAYACIATTGDAAHRDLEGTIYVIVSPLRFQINTLAEDLRLGGFTHRRVSISQLPFPAGTTREQFEFMWMTPDGLPATLQPSPEMYIQLQSPQQFGLYTVRVRGLNSGYKHELQSEVFVQYPPPNGYTLRISGQAGTITPNSRVEVLCELQPVHPVGANIRWLNAQNMPVAPDGRLIIDRFNTANEGSYVCEAALPDGLILRQLLSLQMGDGSISGGGEGLSPYTIYIVRYPTYFSYGDEIRLQCLVRPDPTDVVYEWKKNGQSVGSKQTLRIPAFGPSDAGLYRCRATIRGIVGYAEEILTSPTDDTRELVMNPLLVNTSVFKPFHIECVSHRLGVRPAVVFSSGANITLDGQFQIQHPDSQKVVISVPMGLSAVYNGMSIQCILPNGYSKETRIFIYDPCPAGQVRCLSGECVSGDKICNGISDCGDGSDESGQFCSAKLVAFPVKQEVRPLERFQVTCRSTSPRQIPSARIPMTGMLVEQDPRFVVTRPLPEEMVIVAPHGLPQHNQAILIECFFPNEGTRTALITLNATGIFQPCPEGFLCRDGACLPPWQRCDGRAQCLDGSDEANCPPPVVTCLPGQFRCSNGQCVHDSQRCDGRYDCSDRSDEAGCPPLMVTCRPGEFRCSNGQCVHDSQRCDGRYDCSDRSDEVGCPPLIVTCRPGEFICSNGQCVHVSQRCDGRYDCLDGSDEENCPPPIGTCRPGEFRCSNGQCVHDSQRCDGRYDCSDRSDEVGCPPIERPCRPDEFLCSGGQCVPTSSRCDGRYDCSDGSDEAGCEGVIANPDRIVRRPWEPFSFTCTVPNGNRPVVAIGGTNIRVEERSDFTVSRPSINAIRVTANRGLREIFGNMTFECFYEGGDRRSINVFILPTCPTGMYTCRDGTCFVGYQLCNGVSDCQDGSDEDPKYCAEYAPPSAAQNITIPPRRPFEFTCSAPEGSRPVIIIPSLNNLNVEKDLRFMVTRPLPNTMRVRAVYGLTEADNGTSFMCLTEPDTRQYITVTVETKCVRGQNQCGDGACLPISRFCDGSRDCSDGSDENRILCPLIRPGVTITPASINVRPRQPFSFKCTSVEGTRPEVYLSRDQKPLSTDHRFKVDRPNYNTAAVSAPHGLLEIHDGMVFTCVIPTGEKSQVAVTIDHPCGRGRFRCEVGTCIAATSVCDGQRNCPDGSDEDYLFCIVEPSGVIVSPPFSRVHAWSQFNFSCVATRGSDPVVIFADTGMSIDEDPRFRIQRPNGKTILVHAPQGIHAHSAIARFVCITSEGGRGEILVSVESICGPGESQCRSGECVRTSQLCDGFPNCKDSSDEFPVFCRKPPRGVVTIPNAIKTPPWFDFTFICAGPASSRADLVFSHNRRPVAGDPRFEVVRLNENIIQVTAPHGLRGMDDVTIECFLPTDEKDLVKITVEDPCPFGQSQCKDGRCVDATAFCNVRRDCSDGSDEDPKFCPTITQAPEFAIYPDKIVTPPWKHFTFVCIAPPESQATVIFQKDGRQIEGDPRFDVFRRNGKAIEVSAPFGLRQIDSMSIDPRAVVIQVVARRGLPIGDDMMLACVTRLGDRRIVTITVKDPCPSSQMSCADGECIDRDRFCDGRPDCADGSDELKEFCPSQLETVEITPEMIEVSEWTPFSFLCRGPQNSRIKPIFTLTGLPVANDSRFDVTGLDTENVQVFAVQGLRSIDDTEITCVTDREIKKAISITISTYCGLGETGCRDGTCIPTSNLCDGRHQCPDRSDETREFCGEIEITPPIGPPPECRPNEFQCRDGACIPGFYICDDVRHCEDGSDESLDICGVPKLPVTIIPRSIRVYEWTPFKFVCSSDTGRIAAHFKANGRLVESDRRFRVTHINYTTIEVSAPAGLRNIDSMKIECISTSGDRNSIQITIDSHCLPGKSQCKDGQCIPTERICDLVAHCKDHTDEIPDFCQEPIIPPPRPPVIVSPPTIDVPSYHPFEFTCISSDGSPIEAVFKADSSPVDRDPRFHITRYNESALVISAPFGLRDIDDLQIECLTSTGQKGDIIITVPDRCVRGYTMCNNGDCIPVNQLCDGFVQCPDGSDEDVRYCREPTKPPPPPVHVSPPRIDIQPWLPFDFICVSSPNTQLTAVFKDGSPVDRDPRFRISRLNASAILVSAPYGLRDSDDMRIECVTTVGDRAEVAIYVNGTCGLGYTRCRDGTCIPVHQLCDGTSQCRDNSDEESRFCREPIRPPLRPGIIITPPSISILAWRSFEFICISPDGSRLDAVFKKDGSPVDDDPRFRVNRYNASAIYVNAIAGLRDIDDLRIECVSATGQREEITITIPDECKLGFSKCTNGECIRTSQFCDGISNCRDGSDEDPLFCEVSVPTPRPPRPGLIVYPPRIDVPAWRPFEFTCISPDGGRISAVFKANGLSLENDRRFQVVRYNTSAIQLRAPYGLLDIHDMEIECVSDTGPRQDINIMIRNECDRGYTKCKDGSCIQVSQLCDLIPQCRDGSDEDLPFCEVPPRPPAPPVVVYPPIIDVPAWQTLEFTCHSPEGSRIDAVFGDDGSSVEADQRFRVMRYNASYIRISAPDGLPDNADTLIECVDAGGRTSNVSITVSDNCGRGYTKCKDGNCIHALRWCDGVRHCRDSSDEDPRFCRVPIRPPTPPIIVSPPVIEVPAWQTFTFTCFSPERIRLTVIFKADGSIVDRDPRFRVTHYNDSYIQVTATEGLPDFGDMHIECVDEMKRGSDVSISILDECGRGYTKCKDGLCITMSQWCDRIPHCRDGSDENYRLCEVLEPERPPVGPVIAIPPIINVPAWESFEFTCYSSDGSRMSVVFKDDGSPVDADPRFQITRYNSSTLQVRAPEGLPDTADVEIECVAESGRRTEITITVLEECRRGYTLCMDGQCIRKSQWCDGALDCTDGSDEDPRFCLEPIRPPAPAVIVTPSQIDVPAWQPFNFTCISTDGSRLRAVFSVDGSSVDSDSRFRITAYNASALLVNAVYGIRDIDDMQIECVSLTGGIGNVTISVYNECPRGYSKCRDGACIPSSQLCDGTAECHDRSDEDPSFCREPVRLEVTPPRILSPPWTPFRFICIASQGERPSVILLRNRKPIELVPHFTVRRPEDNVIEVFAPQGLATFPAEDQLACVTITGQQKEVPITISNPCRYGQLPCKDRTCVSERDFCNGRNDCPDGSDESTIACPDMPSGVRVTPEKIDTPPWREFTFTCTDILGRGLPTAIISDSRQFVASDPRFHIVEINSSSIEITAIHGLRGSDDSMSIDCISRRGDGATVVITVEDSCGLGQLQCRDGRCLPGGRFCDGRRDCPDGSDEDMSHCKWDALIVTPSYMRNPPWIAFSFLCIAPPGQRPNVVFAVNGRSVEEDPRFTINRLNSSTIEVNAPRGFRGDEEVVQLECVTDVGLRENVTIFIDDMCKPNAMQCRDGQCRSVGDFCDGKRDCADGSDELRQFCDVARPPKLVLTPQRVVIQPWQQFRTICISTTGLQPSFIFTEDQSLVDNDQRYLVNRINATAIELLAPRGLRGQQDADTIDCINPVGDRVNFEIIIESSCRPDQMACQDGECLPASQFCDDRFDCYDKSDEIYDFCPARRPSVIATPESIATEPWQLIRFYCISPEGHPLTVMFSANRQLVKEDPRYHVRLLNSTTMEVVVSRGLRGPEESTQIDCMITSGERKRVTITVKDKCGSGRLPCRDGTCLSGMAFCDGKRDCFDGSDEYNEYCAKPTPPPPTLPTSVRLSPSRQRVRPGQEIRLECNALSSDVRDSPIVEFANGTSVALDPNFRVSYPQPGRVVVIIPRGMELSWRHMEFQCYLPGGAKSTAEVFIDQACDIGQRRCDNGQCIYFGQFCDGKIDCADGSDELPHNCQACDPISRPCGKVNGRDPQIPFFQEHWRCDGENDCGNGFDEQNCEAYSRVPGTNCGRAQFECSGGGRIPLAYQCDSQPDCPDGDDEHHCMRPSIYTDNFTSRYEMHRGQNLVIECDVVGVPPPAIVWRHNWGCLPQGDRAIVEPVVSQFGCGGARSRLTIKNVQEGDDGIYNCEALTGTDRALSQDIFVLLID